MAAPGERIGSYEVVRLIARGGMATVYEARQPALGRAVALKRLDLRVDEPMLLERFIRESRLAATFDHPNIVTVFDFFECDGVPYIAMEYLPRGSLRSVIGHLRSAQVFGVLEGMLAALGHAEAHGVAHRDLKPENVLITHGGAVKIADFGIAKTYGRATSQLTAAGVAIGTPAYMAPEQAMSGEVGPATDLYALGVMAYEMLSGAPPFSGGDSPLALMLQHVNEAPPPLAAVDSRLAAWVARLLAKAPEDRPAGAAQAWADLEEVVVDAHGPYWRRGAALGEQAPGSDTPRPDELAAPAPPTRDYITATPPVPPGPRREDVMTPPPPPPPAEDVPVPPPAPPEPAIVVPPEPEPEPEPEIAAPAEPEPEVAAAPEPDEPAPAPAPPAYVTAVTVPGLAGPPRRSRRLAVVAGAGGVVAAGVLAIALASGGGDDPAGADGAKATPVPPPRAAPPYDFAGDGRTATVAGLPGRGLVLVAGAGDPLRLPGPQRGFGSAVASGDFDGDARADLAIGAPGARSVTIRTGSPDGLDGGRTLNLDGPRGFGAALAAGDLDGDGYDDLVAGAPGAGSIRLLLGGPEGLDSSRGRTIDAAEGAGDGFGSLLALGDVDGDDRLDVVEAGPGHSSFCAGARRGPTDCVTFGDGGPAAQAVADLTGDGRDDVVQGFPGDGSGRLRLWRGSSRGPRRPIDLTQGSPGVRGTEQDEDEFGAALVASELDGDAFADVVVGAPGEDASTGRVTIVRGARGGFEPIKDDAFSKGTDGLARKPKPGSRFGASLALLDADGDGALDLTAAAPGDRAVLTLPGANGTFTGTGSTALALPGDEPQIALGAP